MCPQDSDIYVVGTRAPLSGLAVLRLRIDAPLVEVKVGNVALTKGAVLQRKEPEPPYPARPLSGGKISAPSGTAHDIHAPLPVRRLFDMNLNEVERLEAGASGFLVSNPAGRPLKPGECLEMQVRPTPQD